MSTAHNADQCVGDDQWEMPRILPASVDCVHTALYLVHKDTTDSNYELWRLYAYSQLNYLPVRMASELVG